MCNLRVARYGTLRAARAASFLLLAGSVADACELLGTFPSPAAPHP